MRGLFVTGTDTGVGKTWISCLIARQLEAAGVSTGVYKPVCSGSEEDESGLFWPDIRALTTATQDRFPVARICPQQFHAPLAPPVAAELESKSVNGSLLRTGVDWWREQVEFLVIEGVGGLLCPLTTDQVVADLVASLQFPLLIVSRPTLGTINHTLLTLAAAQARSLPTVGVVMNQSDLDIVDADLISSNARQIRQLGKTSIVGYCGSQCHGLVDAETGESVNPDWFSLGRCAE